MSIIEKLRTAKKSTEQAPKRFRIHLTMPILVIAGIILMVTLGWSFFMGFLVGRGEDPGTRLNSLPIFGGGSKKEEPEKKPEPTPEVVAETPKAEEEPEAEAPKEKPKPVHPFTRPQGASVGAWGNQPQEPKNQPKKEQPKPEPEKKVDPNEPRYEVRYQVASFPREADAMTMSKQCRARGLNAQPQLFGKVYRVVITFRGTVKEAAAMKANSRGLGIKKWIIITSRSLNAPKTAPKPEKKAGR